MIRSIPLGCGDLPLSVASAVAEAVAATVGALRPLFGLPVVALALLLIDHVVETFAGALVAT